MCWHLQFPTSQILFEIDKTSELKCDLTKGRDCLEFEVQFDWYCKIICTLRIGLLFAGFNFHCHCVQMYIFILKVYFTIFLLMHMHAHRGEEKKNYHLNFFPRNYANVWLYTCHFFLNLVKHTLIDNPQPYKFWIRWVTMQITYIFSFLKWLM